MPRVFEEGSEERKYVEQALATGQSMNDTATVLLVSRLLNKPVLEVQSAWMDVKVGIQQVFRDTSGIGLDT